MPTPAGLYGLCPTGRVVLFRVNIGPAGDFVYTPVGFFDWHPEAAIA